MTHGSFTPKDSALPYTPGHDHLSPMTPATPMDGTADAPAWAIAGVEVTLTSGETGHVVEALGQNRVKIKVNGAEQVLGTDQMEATRPAKNDSVKIIGPATSQMKGLQGKLIGIDGSDGIVKMTDDLDIKIMDMTLLVRCVEDEAR